MSGIPAYLMRREIGADVAEVQVRVETDLEDFDGVPITMHLGSHKLIMTHEAAIGLHNALSDALQTTTAMRALEPEERERFVRLVKGEAAA